MLSVLLRPALVPLALSLSSLVRPLGGPELTGVSIFLPVPADVVELDNRGVLGREVGRAAARADSSARGSSSAGVESAVALAGLRVLEDDVDGGSDSEGMSSNWANNSSSVRAFLDAIVDTSATRRNC